MEWFDKAYHGKIVFPFWMQFFDYFVTVHRVEMPFIDALRCYLYLIGPWFFTHLRNLAVDVMVAIWMLLHSIHWRENYYARTDNWS